MTFKDSQDKSKTTQHTPQQTQKEEQQQQKVKSGSALFPQNQKPQQQQQPIHNWFDPEGLTVWKEVIRGGGWEDMGTKPKETK